jgi:hypothetical protein
MCASLFTVKFVRYIFIANIQGVVLETPAETNIDIHVK